MAKATITLPSGTRVSVEGTPAEVEDIVARIDGKRERKPSKPGIGSTRARKPAKNAKPAIKDYVIELRDGGFFRKPQGLAEVKTALEAEGHIIPITTLSGVMLGLVKSRELRRLKEGKTWKYVNR